MLPAVLDASRKGCSGRSGNSRFQEKDPVASLSRLRRRKATGFCFFRLVTEPRAVATGSYNPESKARATLSRTLFVLRSASGRPRHCVPDCSRNRQPAFATCSVVMCSNWQIQLRALARAAGNSF